MRITVSQPGLSARAGKKLNIEFRHEDNVDNYSIDKAEDFLVAIDRFIKKRRISSAVWKKARMEFLNTGILTERVVKAIMLGLGF